MFVYIRSAAFVIVGVTQKLVLQQSKNVTAKCTETLTPPPSIQYFIGIGETQYLLRQKQFCLGKYVKYFHTLLVPQLQELFP